LKSLKAATGNCWPFVEAVVLMQDPSPDPTRYVVTREGERWVFRPDAMLVALMVGMFAGGSTLFVSLAIVYAGTWPVSVILLLLAGLLAGCALWAWWTRHTALTVEPGGRVCYGARELCAAGTVRAVRVVEARTGEVGDCGVYLELEGGKRVSLSMPSPYFVVPKKPEQARVFAGQLARVLGVGVTESAES
jgi:hypothetical protein